MNNVMDKYKDYLNSDYSQAYEGDNVGKISNVKKTENLEKILASREKIRKRSCETVTFSPPIISFDDVGIIYPNTINIIQGKKGVHKSRLTEVFCALMLCQDLNKKFLGMKRNAMSSSVVLYVDTERNINDQFPYAIQKIKTMSGFEKESEPSNLDFISLIDVPRQERFATLKEYIDTFRVKFQAYNLLIVFDVVTDCVEDFNNVRESLKFVDMLNETINNYNVTFLCVIHENPASGNDKGRGHLGTELNNKASQVMQIGFEKDNNNNDTDLIRIKFLHSRNTKRLEPIYIQYSEESKGLVLADTSFISEKLALKQSKANIGEVHKWMTENLIEPMSKSEIIEKLKVVFDCEDRTLEKRLTDLIEQGSIERYTVGRNAFYRLLIPF
jgi:hypothetical protein